jgi:GTP pyrophosphokinase
MEVSRTYQPMLTKRFDRALAYASELHRNQLRKGVAIPYLAHLMGVASLVLEYGGDEDQAIAALLHDSIEDQGVTDDEIADRFGSRVASIVRDCTDSDAEPRPPWLERKRHYLEHLRDCEPAALIVSLADKVNNARAIASDYRRDGEATFARFSGGAAGTRWYHRRLLETFSGRFLQLPSDRPDRPGGAGLVRQYDDAITQFGATSAAADEYERDHFSSGSLDASSVDRQGDGDLPQVDADGAAVWIAEHADIPPRVVRLVLDLEWEFMVGVGIVDEPDHEFAWYHPDGLAALPAVVVEEDLVADARRLLGVRPDVAQAVFEREREFLRLRGLLGEERTGTVVPPR